MKLIEQFADLAEVIGGNCPDEHDPSIDRRYWGNPTYKATDPNAWDYD